MANVYYIASCVFTRQFPQLSERIQAYVSGRHGIPIVRCCLNNHNVQKFEEQMPESYRPVWQALPSSTAFQPGDTVYSLCHNCSNIIEEMWPGVQLKSLFELIMEDKAFSYPDYSGKVVTVQDCWRAQDRLEEQQAVRLLLEHMGIRYLEAKEHHGDTNFCGATLYRTQPPRNPSLAPKHYVEKAKGKFIDHTPEEQKQIMAAYVAGCPTKQIVCYCHYCLEGLLLGGGEAVHLIQLLFA